MPNVIKETLEIDDAQDEGGGVVIGVEGDSLRLHQFLINKDANEMIGIVQKAERRDRPRGQSEVLHQSLGRGKTQLAVADLIGHLAQIGALGMSQDDEIVPIALLIAQKEILAVNRIDVSPVEFGFGDGIDRRMVTSIERNPQDPETLDDWLLSLVHVWIVSRMAG